MEPWKRKEVIGDCQLFLGDCRDILPVLPKVDAVMADPPYGVGKCYDSFDDTEENAAAITNYVVSSTRHKSERILMFSGMRMMWDLPKAD